MIFKLFRRNPNEALITRLHDQIMTQARSPALFLEYGVSDTPEGRFEMVAVHVLLAVRRLSALPEPGPAIAQDLTDAMFRHFDIAFREMGLSDTTVPKRMKKHASAWLGRARAYGAAMDSGDTAGLAQALSRNVYGIEGDPPERPLRLSRYIGAVMAALTSVSLEDFLNGKIPFAPPETVV